MIPLARLRSLTDAQTRQLHALFQDEWWTRGRTLEDVRTMLSNTDYLFARAELETDRLVGFARVLTDRIYKALIFDVIVAPSHRGRGIGRDLIEEILAHPELVDVRHFELYCLPDMVPFYERLGFGSEVSGVRLLRRQAP